MNVLIVDDELFARQELAYLVNEHPAIDEIREAESVGDAFRVMLDFKPDILFLDIQLDGETGFDLAEQLMKTKNPPYLIFATAYDEYAIDAFKVDADDYILKPFEKSKIHDAIDKCLKKADKLAGEPQKPEKKFESLAVQVGERVYMVDPHNIILATVDGHTLRLETTKANYEFSDSLTSWEKKLPESLFLRTHRAYLINVDHVKEIQPWFNQTYQVTMTNDSKVPVSRTYIKEFKKRLNFD